MKTIHNTSHGWQGNDSVNWDDVLSVFRKDTPLRSAVTDITVNNQATTTKPYVLRRPVRARNDYQRLNIKGVPGAVQILFKI